MQLRTARSRDLKSVCALLREAQLPELDGNFPLRNLIAAVDEGTVVGAVGLEVYGRSGLLRSLVVASSHRGRGLARELFRSLLARVHELGLNDVFLLTLDAQGLFEKLGFETLPREAAPLAIRNSEEFRKHCPESAVLMRLDVAEK